MNGTARETEPIIRIQVSKDLFLPSPILEKFVCWVWVIGGAQIYTLAMQSPYFHRLYLTYIHAKFGCDTYFPFMKQELEYGSAFRRLSREEIDNPRVPVEIQTDPTSGLQFEIRVYGRRNPDYNEY